MVGADKGIAEYLPARQTSEIQTPSTDVDERWTAADQRDITARRGRSVLSMRSRSSWLIHSSCRLSCARAKACRGSFR